MLHTRLSHNIIQLEEYKIEFSKCARLPDLLMTRMHDRLTWVEFHTLSSTLLLIGQKSKIVKLVYLVNRFFQMFSSRLQTFVRKDCSVPWWELYFFSQIFAITISITQLQVCFHLLCCIFSMLALYALSIFNKCRHFIVARCRQLYSRNSVYLSLQFGPYSFIFIHKWRIFCHLRRLCGIKTSLLEYKYCEIFPLVFSVICTLMSAVE